jgi:hypothetical protein
MIRPLKCLSPCYPLISHGRQRLSSLSSEERQLNQAPISGIVRRFIVQLFHIVLWLFISESSISAGVNSTATYRLEYVSVRMGGDVDAIEHQKTAKRSTCSDLSRDHSIDSISHRIPTHNRERRTIRPTLQPQPNWHREGRKRKHNQQRARNLRTTLGQL